MSQVKMKLEKETTKNISMDYLLHLPNSYNEEKKWPLILFLHGMGERGENLELLKKHGLPKYLDTVEDFPFVVVSPQCPSHSNWERLLDDVYELLKEIKKDYSIDENRLYLTGLSMGGYGTWSLATKYPHEFAAIAPICGGLKDKSTVRNIKHLPIWVFHGEKDTIVPLIKSQILVDILEECGGNVKFTVYPELEHDSWTKTYNNEELYQWFLKHSLK